jgi:signal transduction histidine kinase
LKNRPLLLRFILFLLTPFWKLAKLFLYPFKKLALLLLGPAKKAFEIFMDKTRKSIRMELMMTFGICLLGSIIIYGICNNYLRRTQRNPYISYENSVKQIAQHALLIVEDIKRQKYSINDANEINDLVNRRYNQNGDKIMITDLEGRIIYKSSGVSETEIDIYNVIKTAMELRDNESYGRTNREARKEVISFYPVDFKESKNYIILKGIPEGQIMYNTYTSNNSFMALLIAVGCFILLFIVITNKKMRYIEEISLGLKEISKGNLEFRVVKRGDDELALLSENINNMAEEIQNRIETERRAEKTKNELITNVSHDLRTPLTSVMGYIGLIKDKKYADEEQMNEYLEIAAGKAEKLKSLIEDLFEYTKLTNEGIKLYPHIINLNEFIDQLIEELIPLCEENELGVIRNITSERITVKVDPDKMLRVFENLITNGIKYSHKPGDINVSLFREGEKAVISVRNKGKNIPKEELPKLFERFYRLDKSRTAATGGSGLGLAIAKNIVELHKGNIWAECDGEDISFYVSLEIEK